MQDSEATAMEDDSATSAADAAAAAASSRLPEVELYVYLLVLVYLLDRKQYTQVVCLAYGNSVLFVT